MPDFMADGIRAFRERRRLAIPSWLLVFLGAIWKLLEITHTTSWIIEELLRFPTIKRFASSEIVMTHLAVVPLAMMIIGLLWLGAVAFWPEKKRSNLFDEAEKLGEITFDYLPHRSPLDSGWKLANEARTDPAPTFSSLPADAPIQVGMKMKQTGWRAIDFELTEARTTKCNRLKFCAKFGTNGILYTLIQMPSITVEQKPMERWIKFGVNIGPSRTESGEGTVSISGMPLRDGWESFDVSLDDAVRDTFGAEGFVYGEYGKLLKIRLRGSLSISQIEFVWRMAKTK